jgi:hypothetical protein
MCPWRWRGGVAARGPAVKRRPMATATGLPRPCRCPRGGLPVEGGQLRSFPCLRGTPQPRGRKGAHPGREEDSHVRPPMQTAEHFVAPTARDRPRDTPSGASASASGRVNWSSSTLDVLARDPRRHLFRTRNRCECCGRAFIAPLLQLHHRNGDVSDTLPITRFMRTWDAKRSTGRAGRRRAGLRAAARGCDGGRSVRSRRRLLGTPWRRPARPPGIRCTPCPTAVLRRGEERLRQVVVPAAGVDVVVLKNAAPCAAAASTPLTLECRCLAASHRPRARGGVRVATFRGRAVTACGGCWRRTPSGSRSRYARRTGG